MQKISEEYSRVFDSNGKSRRFYPIPIPTNNSFTKQWYNWVRGKVNRHFKRNKERAIDTTQQVFLRMISKDIIGRWFYKHLTNEFIDRNDAERILGLKPGDLTYIDQLKPSHGRRSDPDSLWLVRDVLTYAKFDYERYYYSIQNHTIPSERVIRLLGYPKGDVSILESLYRQGRLKPSELTEHDCSERFDSNKNSISYGGICLHPECHLSGLKPISLGFCNRHKSHRKCSQEGCEKEHFSRGYCQSHYSLSKKIKCSICDHGRSLLKSRGLSLSHRWDSSTSISAALKLRWNDSQLKPFLRNWHRQNMIYSNNGAVVLPRHILREDPKRGIDAGLLAYTSMIIDHAVVNEFKTITRSDDLPNTIFNGGLSPEFSNTESVSWETDEKDEKTQIIKDTSFSGFGDTENRLDIENMIKNAGLSSEESNLINMVDVSDLTIKNYAESIGKTIQQVHKIRNSAIRKMRKFSSADI